MEPSETDTHTNPPAISRLRILTLTLQVEGGLFVVACVLGLLTGVRFWERVETSAPALASALALTLPLLAGMGVASLAPVPVVKQIRRDIERILPLFRNCTVMDLLLISLLAGIGEEALFRGVLQPLLAGPIGTIPALILVALLFGAVHPVSFAYVVFAAGIGLYLGAIQIWSDNLFVPAAVHGLYDFAALVYLLRIYPQERMSG